MKFSKTSLLLMSVLTFVCLLPLWAVTELESVNEPPVPSYVKYTTGLLGQEPGAPDRFFLFIGRFHPLLLHLPIGVTVIAFLMQAYATWKKRQDFYLPCCFALGFALLTAFAAVLSGSLLSMSNEYNPDLLDRHAWGALVFTALLGVAFLFKVAFIRSDMKKDSYKKTSIVVLSAALGVMSFVGHDGGSLTHGRTYLFEYGPDFVRKMGGLPPYKAPGQVHPQGTVYEELVAPFLKQNCYKCHNQDKVKGKLRLDTIDFIKQGGKTKEPKLIVHGDAANSYMYQLMISDDEDEVMPPDGRLPKIETDFIKWWIDTAADDQDLFERKVKDANVPEKFLNINLPGKVKLEKAHKGANEEDQSPAKEQTPEDAKKEDNNTEEEKTPVGAPTKTIGTASPELTASVDFAREIAPILEARCVKCHGAKKQKGDYRLDKAEFITKAGDSGEAPIVAGQSTASYLVKLIKMTEEDDDVMPPKGGLLQPEQIALIVKWIDEGAKFPADLQLQDKSPKK